MNKLRSYIFFLLLISFNNLFAQKNIIKVNPLSFTILSIVNFSYERVISDSSSLQVTGFYRIPHLRGEDTKFTIIGVVVDFRYYLVKEALNNVYISPFLRFRRYYQKEYYPFYYNGSLIDYSSASLLGTGFLIGCQFFMSKDVTYDLFLGPSYDYFIDVKGDRSNFDFINTGDQLLSMYLIRAGMNIGFAF